MKEKKEHYGTNLCWGRIARAGDGGMILIS